MPHCQDRYSVVRIGIIALISCCLSPNVFAQSISDSIPVTTLAAQVYPSNNQHIVLEANADFPSILMAEKEQASNYVAEFSTKRKQYLVRMYDKGKKMLPAITKIFHQYHLPEELKVLIILESAYQSNVVSPAGAVGYWQMMDPVAQQYGLQYVKQLTPAELKKLQREDAQKADSVIKALAKQRDDRTHFLKSTHAAARYLCDSRRNLNSNWLLVVASYNCGIGNVWKAMAKTGLASPSFWDLKAYLPKETQQYVMNFIALNVVYHNYKTFLQEPLRFAPETRLVANDQAVAD